MSDTMKALDEIEAALNDIEAQQQYLRVGGAYVDDTGQLETGLERAVEVAGQALSLLPTLRAALTSPADDVVGDGSVQVAYYRAKHREWQQMGPGDRYEQHDAIGVLFRAHDALAAKLAKERERRGEVEVALQEIAQTSGTGCNPEGFSKIARAALKGGA